MGTAEKRYLIHSVIHLFAFGPARFIFWTWLQEFTYFKSIKKKHEKNGLEDNEATWLVVTEVLFLPTEDSFGTYWCHSWVLKDVVEEWSRYDHRLHFTGNKPKFGAFLYFFPKARMTVELWFESRLIWLLRILAELMNIRMNEWMTVLDHITL